MGEISLPLYDPEQARSAGLITYVNALLTYLDPHSSESGLWRRSAAIGIDSDEAFDEESLDRDLREAIDA